MTLQERRPRRAGPAARSARRPRRGALLDLARSGTAVMLGGTLAATVLAYAFQLLGARWLGPVAFAPVTALWTVQFLVMTVVMVPVEQLVIRQMVLSGGLRSGLKAPSVAALLVLAVVVAGVATAVTPELDPGWAWGLLAVALVVTYTVFAAARGVTAGRRQYRRYGGATAAEALLRVVLALAVLAVTRDPWVLGLVLVAAPLGVLAVRPFAAVVADRTAAARSGRAAAPLDGVELVEEPSVEVVVGAAGRFLVPLVVANAACQTLLGVGPLVVAGLGAGASAVTAVFLTFTLFRGPLWVIQSALARVLPPFTAMAGRPAALRRWSLALGAGGLVLGAVAVGAGYWLGPWLVSLLFGDGVQPGAWFAALVAAGSAVAATSLFSGQVLVARGSTPAVALAWCLGLAAAVAVGLLLPGLAADLRVAAGFLAGEVCALLAMTALGLRARDRPAPTSTTSPGSTPTTARRLP